MRGPQTLQGGIFSYVSLESRIPEDHPLRAIRRLVDAALERLSRRFDGIYAKGVGVRTCAGSLSRASPGSTSFGAESRNDFRKGIRHNQPCARGKSQALKCPSKRGSSKAGLGRTWAGLNRTWNPLRS